MKVLNKKNFEEEVIQSKGTMLVDFSQKPVNHVRH